MLESVKTLKFDQTNSKLHESKNQKISFKSNSSNTLERTPEADKVEDKKGLSKGAKWAIGLGVATLVAGVVYLATKGKSKPKAPINPKPEAPKPEASKPDLKEEIERGPIILEENVFVGSHSFIGKNTHIGHHSVVAAGTIIIDGGEIPPYSLLKGNPAKVYPGIYRDKVKNK